MLGHVKCHANIDSNIKSGRALYLSLFRPFIGYATLVWAPSEIKAIKAAEQLERHSTKYILANPDINYHLHLIINKSCLFHIGLKLMDDNYFFFYNYLKSIYKFQK